MPKTNLAYMGLITSPLEMGQLALDIDRLVETRLLATASSGGGKSFLLRRAIEEAYGKTQIIILDPEGEFSTLRPTHDFIILGGDGDLQLVPHHAATYATKFLELRRDLVVDLYELEIHQRQAFVRDFLNAMINAPRHLWHNVLVILDEAHEFAPEKSPATSSSAVIAMASKGRKRGYALLLATQRLAKLSKDSAAECQNKLVGLANLPDDRKRGAEELGLSTKEEVLTLRDLERGEFYAVGPAFQAGLPPRARLKGIAKAQLALPKTRPPRRGAGRSAAPAASAKLKAELKKLAELPKEAEKDLQDKEALKGRVRELEAALRSAAPKESRVNPQAPVLVRSSSDPPSKAVLERFRAQEQREAQGLAKARLAEGVKAFITKAREAESELLKALAKPWPKEQVLERHPPEAPQAFAGRRLDVPTGAQRRLYAQAQDLLAKTSLPTGGAKVTGAKAEGKVGICERKILAFLQIRGDRWTSRAQVGAMSDYVASSGNFGNCIGNLVGMGVVERAADGRIRIKPGVNVDDLVGDAKAQGLQDWIRQLGKCDGAIFQLLLKQPDRLWSRAELAVATGYESSSGNFGNNLGALCTKQLAARDGGCFRLHPELQEFL